MDANTAELAAVKSQIEDNENELAALTKRAAELAARKAVVEISLTACRAHLVTLNAQL